MIEVVSNCLHDFLLMFKYFLTQFFGSLYVSTNILLPGLAIGIAISAIFLGIKIIKSVIWRS